MRVLHVINQISAAAGAERSLHDILVGLQSAELQHGLVVLRPDRGQIDGLGDLGIATFPPSAPLRSVADRVRHVRSSIRSFSPDLVHTTLFEANVAGRVAARMSGVPALTSLVNTPYVPEARRDRAVHPVKLRLAHAADVVLSRYATTAFHAITQAVADAAVHALWIDPAKITVVPRGRSREKLGEYSRERRQASRAALGLPEEMPVLIHVGRQEPQKGQTYLLGAMVEIRRRYPDVVLLLVGPDGNRTPAVERTIATLGLGGAVRRLGVRQDVADLLCAADVFVFPSLYEGLGGAVLEAMALHVPIVASGVPATTEVLDEGRCGLLVPVSDVEALARAVVEVLADPEGARLRADAAERRFCSTYDLPICLEGMRELYRRVGGPTGTRHADEGALPPGRRSSGSP